MSTSIVSGKRRFTCLSPTLIRMEFAPDGRFEERRSIIASEEQHPVEFTARETDGDRTVLKTEKLTLRVRDHDRPFRPLNTEVNWIQNGLMQSWRPGDRDYRNLGGTLRSLDRYGRGMRMEGVHVADMDAPDAKGMRWLAWLDCEEDPASFARSPAPPTEKIDRHRAVAQGDHEGRMLERSYNSTADAHRFGTGVLSRSGYWLLNDSESAVMNDDGFPVERDRPGAQDWYFFGYGGDYRAALRDFRNLCGPACLPTHNALGLMFSRWPAYDEREAKEIIASFEQNGYPLSVLVLDMEWHREGWGHWDWNEELYDDPAAFFAYCHERGIHVTLNDHPLWIRSDDSHFEPYLEAADARDKVEEKEYRGKTLPMAEIDVCNRREAEAFFSICHSRILEQGLDFWWNDGYCGERNGVIGQLVMNKLNFEEIEKTGKRGMLLARYGGLGSHRYGGFFTGDTGICWDILRLQVEFNIRAAGVGHSWISHDIGGFCGGQRKDGRIDPELYLRWMQFGVFNPMFRFHSAPDSGSRLPWKYVPEGGESVRYWLQVRNSLLPYIYSAGREAWETGMPVTRGLYLDEPDNGDAYRFDCFRFGPDLLVAPVTRPGGEVEFHLPDGQWWEFESTIRHTGGVAVRRTAPPETIPVHVRAGGILLRQDPTAPLHGGHVERLHLDVYAGSEGEAVLYEDDGATTDFKNGEYCKTRFELRQQDDALVLSGKVVEGAPLGVERTVRVTLSLAGALTAARLDDGDEVAFSQDDRTGRWELTLPAVKADAPFALRLYVKGAIA